MDMTLSLLDRRCSLTIGSALLLALGGCPADGGTTVTAGTTGTSGTGDTTHDNSDGSAAATDGTLTGEPTPTSAPTDGGTEPATTGPTTDIGSSTVEVSATDTLPPIDTDTTTTTGDTAEGSDTSDTSTSTGVMGECEPGEQQACYSGPAKTLNVGLCVGGERTCDAQGHFGACEGEVVPAPDSCNTAGDDGCDGPDECGEQQWYRVIASTSDDSGRRVAYDGAGNLVWMGITAGSVNFGDGELPASGGIDLLLARYAGDGKYLWSKRFGGMGDQGASTQALAVDGAGNIVLAGEFDQAINLGGGSLIAPHADTGFFARLAPDGSHVWSKQLGGAGAVGIPAIAFDGAGNVLLAGAFLDSIDLGGGPVVAVASSDAFVAKYGPDGAYKWGKGLGGPAQQVVRGVAAGAADAVCVGGWFAGSIDLGVGVMASAGSNDAFVGCFDAQGKALWSKRFGDAGDQHINDMTTDAEGRLSLVGETTGVVDFGGGPLGEVQKFRPFAARLDGDGGHAWSLLFTDGNTYARDVAVDGAGSLIVGGEFAGADFGEGKIGSLDSPGTYLLKLDETGALVWYRFALSNFAAVGFGAAVSSTGRAAIAGEFAGFMDFGDGQTFTKGGRDGFVMVYAP